MARRVCVLFWSVFCVGFGHGPELSFDHVPSKEGFEVVWRIHRVAADRVSADRVKTAGRLKREQVQLLGRWSLPGGRELEVARTALPASVLGKAKPPTSENRLVHWQRLSWPRGKVLVFGEGLAAGLSRSHPLQVVWQEENFGLYLMPPRVYGRLNARPSLFVSALFPTPDPVLLKASSWRSLQGPNKPLSALSSEVFGNAQSWLNSQQPGGEIGQKLAGQKGQKVASEQNAKQNAEQATQTIEQIDWSLLRVDRTRLLDHVRALSGETEADLGEDRQPERIANRGDARFRQLTRDMLRVHFHRLGLRVDEPCYRQRFRRGCNLSALLEGKDTSKEILMTAHLDSVTNPGADDDAAGVSALLEIARVLVELGEKPKYSLRFVAFDQEELGLIGSKAYVADQLSQQQNQMQVNMKLQVASVLAVFNIDMMGFDSDNDGQFHVISCDRTDSQPLSDLVATSITVQDLALTPVPYCTNRSDHASFWRVGIPAILVSENFFLGDPNPCYHQDCDRVASLNLAYMTDIAQAMLGSVYALAFAPGKPGSISP